MRNIYKISLLLFILLVSISFVSAADNTTYNQHVASQVTTNTNSISSDNFQNTTMKNYDEIKTVDKVKTVKNSNKESIVNKNIKSDTNTTNANTNTNTTNATTKTNVVINSGNVNGHPGENVTFTGNVTDVNNNTVNTGQVVVKLNDKTVAKTKVYNGSFTVNYTIPANFAGRYYKLKYVYGENNQYNRYELNRTLVVPLNNVLIPTSLTASGVNVHPGENVAFRGFVIGENNTVVNTGTVMIKINDKTMARSTVRNSSFVINYRIPLNFTSDIYTLLYVYAENNQYARSTFFNFVRVSHDALPQVRINAGNMRARASENIIFTGNVTNSNNTKVTSGNIIVKINSKTAAKTAVHNGTFTVNYTIPSNYAAKNYRLQYIYAQNSHYGRYELNRTLTLTRDTTLPKVTIRAGNVTSYPGSDVIFTGRIVDSKNKAVNFGQVVIKVNDKTVSKATVHNGTFSGNYSVPPLYAMKDYRLKYVYAQNNQYSRTELNKVLTLTVNTGLTKVTLTAGNVNRHVGDNIVFTGKVVDDRNHNVNTGRVVVKINDVTVVKTVVHNGTFRGNYTIPLNYAAKDYRLKYVYVQNDQYDRYELNRTLTLTNVIIKAGILGARSGENVTFSGKVVDLNNHNINIGNIIVKINSNTVARTNVHNGTFSVNYTVPGLAGKEYKLTYVYQPTGQYGRSELNTILSVNKAPINVTVKAGNIYCNTSLSSLIIFNGSVIDMNNNPVNEGYMIFKINNDTLNENYFTRLEAPVKNGTFRITYVVPEEGLGRITEYGEIQPYASLEGLPYKTYNFKYVYTGTSQYAEYELNRTLTITD